jgi:uncharacterized membrane protein YesL
VIAWWLLLTLAGGIVLYAVLAVVAVLVVARHLSAETREPE